LNKNNKYYLILVIQNFVKKNDVVSLKFILIVHLDLRFDSNFYVLKCFYLEFFETTNCSVKLNIGLLCVQCKNKYTLNISTYFDEFLFIFKIKIIYIYNFHHIINDMFLFMAINRINLPSSHMVHCKTWHTTSTH
jgi:hypothetical protein